MMKLLLTFRTKFVKIWKAPRPGTNTKGWLVAAFEALESYYFQPKMSLRKLFGVVKSSFCNAIFGQAVIIICSNVQDTGLRKNM